jgi:hypothetical protein
MNIKKAYLAGRRLGLVKQAKKSPIDPWALPAISGLGGAVYGATRSRTAKEKKDKKSRLKMILQDALSFGGAGLIGTVIGNTTGRTLVRKQPLAESLGESVGELASPVADLLANVKDIPGRALSGLRSAGSQLATGFNTGYER